MKKKKLIIASGNKGKIKEISQMCSDLNVEILSLEDAFGEKIDIPETGTTFIANAKLKAHWVCDRKNCWVLADDSGLKVDALEGRPGVYSARFAGVGCSDNDNVEKLLDELDEVHEKDRGAEFVCVMILSGPDGEVISVEGRCRGIIIDAPRGSGGFGYDPVFIPEGYSQTFSELDSSIKNTISHRSKALKQLRGKLEVLFP